MIDLMVVDLQSTELKVLSDFGRFLSELDTVVCEVTLISNYAVFRFETELNEFISATGFTKMMVINNELYDANGRFLKWGECQWRM